MKYDRNEIKESIYTFLGEDGRVFFEDVKSEYGTVWARIVE